jgi:DNA polymerase III subunit alpha
VERGQPYDLKTMYYGNKEEGIKANEAFKKEIDGFKGLWEVASNIEGLISGIGIHAGGIVFVDRPFTDTCALMRAPDGTLISQFELHDLEKLSLIKIDLLSIESADRIQTCLELLMEQNYIEKKATLRETYESALGIYKIERNAPKMWDMVKEHKILSLFQMEQESGIRGIALTEPRSVDDLATLNSVIRLMAQEKGAETPLEKYTRFRKNKYDFEREMIENGLTKEERTILHDQLDISSGLCIAQEQFMRLVQLPECGGWDLQFADKLRRSIAKKSPKEYEAIEKQFFNRVEEKGLHKEFCNYVWNKQIALSKGYGFNALSWRAQA